MAGVGTPTPVWPKCAVQTKFTGGTDVPVCAGTDECAFCCTDKNVCATRKFSLDGALEAPQIRSRSTDPGHDSHSAR